jgi:predicted Zn-ribbon and HTH transcriptional regulator
MPTDLLIFGYVAALLAALSGVALYFEQRRRRFEPAPSKDNIFRCRKCAFVYTDDPDVDRSRCPQCGKSNEAIKF